MMYRYFSILCCFMGSLFLHAQKQIQPEWLTIEDGLSQGFVSSMVQDEEGFMWFGTKNGLNRYDGREFINISQEIQPPFALKGETIYAIHDDHGFMLIGTEYGLNLYQKHTNRFFNIELPNDVNATEKKPIVAKILKDNLGNYWFTEANSRSLYKLNFSDEFFENIAATPYEPTDVSIEKIELKIDGLLEGVCIFQGRVIFFTYEYRNGQSVKVGNALDVETLKVEQLGTTLFKSFQVFWYKPYKNKLLYVNNVEKRLYIYENSDWYTVETDFNISIFSPMPSIGKLLIRTNRGESLIFNEDILHKKKITRKHANAIIEDSKIYKTHVLVDDSDVIWVATSGYGVMKITPRMLNIETYFKDKSIYAKPFVFDTKNVFIENPTTNEKLFLYPPESDQYDFLKDLKGDNYYYFTYDRQGEIWALVWEKSSYNIYKVNANRELEKKATVLENVGINTPLLQYNAAKHELIIVCEHTLYLYAIDDATITSYDLRTHMNGISVRLDVVYTSDDSYWIATNLGILRVWLDTETNEMQFKVYNEKSGLKNTNVSSLLKDASNEYILWIGTKGAGLYKLDIQKEEFTNISTAQGLPNNVIYGILEDEEGQLWMSSNKGIIVYDKNTAKIKNFNETDGLQSSEFNTFAYNKGADGIMYFGGVKGLNIFHPNAFKANPNVPKTWITDLQVNNEPITSENTAVTQNTAIEYLKEIALPYEKNSITLKFAALEYTASGKNRFSYFMEGLEKEWIHTTTDNKANYLSIPSGNYIFKIKSANGDGVWNENYKTLKVIIHPPWYRTTIAYISYILLLLLGVWFVIKIREDRIKKLQQIEKSNLENKLLKAEIAYKQKDLIDFATAISENKKWGNHLLKKIKEIRVSKGRAKGKSFDELEETIKNKTFIEKNQIDFQDRIDTLNNEFYQTLLAQYPKLSKTDLRLCTLIRLNFSTNDIALLQNIAQESVYKSRNRLRKKLSLAPEVDLDRFLKQF